MKAVFQYLKRDLIMVYILCIVQCTYMYINVISSQSVSCFPTDITYMSQRNLKQIRTIIV